MANTEDINKIAYTEILNILRKVDIQYTLKLPNSFLEFLIENAIEDVNNEHTGFDEEGNIKVSSRAETILDYMNLEYWSTEEEKKELTEIYLKNEQEIKEKYNPNNILKNRRENQLTKENMQLEKHKKENIFIRIITKLKRMLKK